MAGIAQRGQAIVEFGLIVVIAVTMLLGAIDFARVFYTQMAVTNASRVGTQWLMGNPSYCNNPDETRDVIRREAQPFVTFSAITLPSSCTAWNDFSVSVSSNFYFVTPMMAQVLGSANPRTVTGTTVARFREPG